MYEIPTEPTPIPTPPTPVPLVPPIKEPDPDRLPDEEPVPNPDENDDLPIQVGENRGQAKHTG